MTFTTIRTIGNRKQFIFATLAIAQILTLYACSIAPQNEKTKRHATRLTPTGQSISFDASRYTDFDDYIEQTENHLRKFKVYVDNTDQARELSLATPFKTYPSEVKDNDHCTDRNGPAKGIVLIHGLSDMPAAMQDLATAFSRKCFVSYSILLPAHGARPAEMLSVSSTDWINAAQFAVTAMQNEVDDVYVGGFSLGGLIALQLAINNNQIAGVFAISPALSLHKSFFLDQTSWIRHIKKWLDTDLPDDPWRFESIPFNALAETQRLSKSVRNQLDSLPLETPVFLAQSPDDAVVNSEINRRYFQESMVNPNSRLVSYTSTGKLTNNSKANIDSRITYYPSYLPDQRILSYAHQAIHISPDNSHYGKHGNYRICSHDLNTNSSVVENCKRAINPFRGEVFGTAVKRYNKSEFDFIARLTFNPQFNEFIDEIDAFLAEI